MGPKSASLPKITPLNQNLKFHAYKFDEIFLHSKNYSNIGGW
jgi:hypothetical protein